MIKYKRCLYTSSLSPKLPLNAAPIVAIRDIVVDNITMIIQNVKNVHHGYSIISL